MARSNQATSSLSHLVQVRGLKCDVDHGQPSRVEIAPRAGAWIEIFDVLELEYGQYIAPRAGAWIEICLS